MRGESLVVFCVPAMLHKSTKQTETPRQGARRGQAVPCRDASRREERRGGGEGKTRF